MAGNGAPDLRVAFHQEREGEVEIKTGDCMEGKCNPDAMDVDCQVYVYSCWILVACPLFACAEHMALSAALEQK